MPGRREPGYRLLTWLLRVSGAPATAIQQGKGIIPTHPCQRGRARAQLSQCDQLNRHFCAVDYAQGQ